MKATAIVICFPKQSKVPRKPRNTQDEKPKGTVLDWIRNGYQFPGKPTPNPEPKKEGGAPFPFPPPPPEPNPKPKPPAYGGVQ